MLFFTAAAATLLLHAATNLIHDYYSIRLERVRSHIEEQAGRPVDGRMNPKDMLAGGLLLLTVAVGFGIFLYLKRGCPIILFGLAGISGGYFYTCSPFSYRFRAIGEFLVFAMMGPLMVWGSHFVQTGSLDIQPLLISLPVGFLVAAILYANNLRDLEDDMAMGMKTQAILLGARRAKIVYGALLFSAYAFVAMFVLLRQAPLAALLVLLTIPAAVRVNRKIQQMLAEERKRFAMVEVLTAQLHVRFGLLLVLGFILGHFAGI